jgi:heme-degrading monooxygenase HmoA
MLELAQLDEATPYQSQLSVQTGPVVIVNTFLAPAGRTEEVLAAWKLDAQYFQRQPGYISTQLHRGIGSSRALVNVAVWESAGHLRAAFSAPDFQDRLANYPAGTVAYPHLYQKVGVAGICVA